MLIIDNPSDRIQYYSLKDEAFVDPNQKISVGSFTESSYLAHVHNDAFIPIHLNEYKTVLPHVYPIPARTRWGFEDGGFVKLKKNIKHLANLDFDRCLKNAYRLMKTISGNVAVELSGGLDSAIVIGVLRKLDYEPVLIGTINQLYKFRTERHIQEIIARRPDNIIQIDSFAKQFSNLLETPPHFLPNYGSLQHYVQSTTFNMLKERGVHYLFQGVGFDSALVDPVGENPNDLRWPTLEDDWLNDYVFSPNQLSYVDVAALPPIRQMLLSLRRGQPMDTQKWWSRNFFSSVIPAELSRFAYKANYGPLWWDGLQSNTDEIIEIVDKAWKITSIPEFKKFSMKSLFDEMNNATGRVGFSLLAYANWVTSLDRANRIAF